MSESSGPYTLSTVPTTLLTLNFVSSYIMSMDMVQSDVPEAGKACELWAIFKTTLEASTRKQMHR